MSEFLKGHTFADTGTLRRVTAATLHDLVESGKALTGMVTEKTELTTTAVDDCLLITDTSDTGATEPKKVQLTNLLPGTIRQGVQQYAAGSLAGGVYTVTLSPAATAYTAGMVVRFTASVANAGGACDIALNALAAKNLFKNATEELEAGDIAAGQVVTAVYDGTQFQLCSPIGRNAPVIAGYKNLVIKTTSTTAIAITADELVVKDANGRPILLTAVSEAIASMTPSVVAGWNYIWIAYNPTTGGVEAHLDASATSPTGFTSGYTYYTLVGACYDAGSTWTSFHQYDNRVYIGIAVAANDAAGPSTTVLTALDISTIVPPIAKSVEGSAGVTAAATATTDYAVTIAGDDAGIGGKTIRVRSAGGATEFDDLDMGGTFCCPIITPSNIFWRAGTTGSIYRITISGFTL